MTRKAFATTIDETIAKNFKIKCVENDVKMNDVLELLMQMYTENKIQATKKEK